MALKGNTLRYYAVHKKLIYEALLRHHLSFIVITLLYCHPYQHNSYRCLNHFSLGPQTIINLRGWRSWPIFLLTKRFCSLMPCIFIISQICKRLRRFVSLIAYFRSVCKSFRENLTIFPTLTS